MKIFDAGALQYELDELELNFGSSEPIRRVQGCQSRASPRVHSEIKYRTSIEARFGSPGSTDTHDTYSYVFR